VGDPPCLVRAATVGDLLGVVRLLERTPDIPFEGLSERQRETWRQMLGTDGLTVYVAELDADVAGTVSALVMPNLGYGCRPSAFVEAMIVAEAHRRRGIGRMLMESLLGDLRDASCDKVQLLSHKRHADDGAHDFYRALGFEPEAEGFRRYLASGAEPPPGVTDGADAAARRPAHR